MEDEQADVRPGFGDDPLHATAHAVELSGNVDGGLNEVGEVRAGKIKLEEAVIPCGLSAGLEPLLVMINDQKFTKTANCWGVDNNSKGTNTNRIVVFRKPDR